MNTNNHRSYPVLFISTIAVLLFLLIVCVSLYKTRQKAVVFDLKSTYTTFLKQVAGRHLSKQQMKQLSHNFALSLSQETQRYAKAHSAVVFTKRSVIAGGTDVTQSIQRRIERNMQRLTKQAKKARKRERNNG